MRDRVTIVQHTLCKNFYQYWDSCRGENAVPYLASFSPEKLAEYDDCGFIFSFQHGDILIDYVGEGDKGVLPTGLIGQPITDIFPLALKAMQMALLMPCFQQKIGANRRSRLWFGHRHKDVEWLFLPALKEDTEEIALVGLSVAFVGRDEKDVVSLGATTVERIMGQNYLAFGQNVDVSVIDSHSWAVLDAMGAKVTVEGENIPHDDRGIAGNAGLVAVEVSRPNVLAVMQNGDMGKIGQRLGGRYNLRIVDTLEAARDILRQDMIDILVTGEAVNDGRGADLITEAQSISAFTACVMMLDQQGEAADARLEENGNLVHHLVKPVGEFALRQALDDAGTYVNKARQEDAG